MAQSSDTSIDAGLSGLAVRNAINENLAALFSSNSGATAPSPTVGGMVWLDSGVSPPVLRIRNNANTAWLAVLPETIAASTFWGNSSGSAAAPAAMTAAQARSVLGFPTVTAGLGQWTLVYAAVNTTIFAPSGGTWAWYLLKRSTINGSVNSIDAGVIAGGGNISFGAANQDMFALCWRVS